MGTTPVRLLIAINSCGGYEKDGFTTDLRETWLPDATKAGIDYKFFVGHNADAKDDVIKVDAGDTYEDLGWKSVEKFRWALNHGYDYAFGADCDTYICPERLLTCGFEQFDYYGDFFHEDLRQTYPHASNGMFCQAGPGFFMSRKAMERFIAEYREGVSDNLIGEIMKRHSDIKIGDGSWKRFTTCLFPDDPGPRKYNDIITCHLSTVRPDGDHNYWHKKRLHYKLYDEWHHMSSAPSAPAPAPPPPPRLVERALLPVPAPPPLPVVMGAENVRTGRPRRFRRATQ